MDLHTRIKPDASLGARVMKKTDVLIVGAGPAGATMALRLAKGGLRVLLADKEKFPREKVCGEFLNPRGVALLKELGLNKAVEAQEPEKVLGQMIHSYDGGVMKGNYGGQNGLALKRPVLDEALLRAVEKKEGVEVWEGFTAEKIDRSNSNFVRIDGKDKNSNRVQVEASLLIGADGVKSFVAKKSGLQPRKNKAPKYALATRFTGVSHQNHGEMFLTPYGYAGLAPLGPESVGLSIVIGKEVSRRIAGDRESLFYEVIRSAPELRARLQNAKQVCPISATGWRTRYLKKITAPRTLLIGDAACFIDPFTGEGMSLALMGAKVAAGTILKTYQKGKDPADALPLCQIRFHQKFFFTAMRCMLLQRVLYRRQMMNNLLKRLGKKTAAANMLIRVCGGVVPQRKLFSLPFWAKALS